ncbi:CCA tRNA nucleotidyltransferase [Sphingomonas sp. GCM10030256]|uniref:CCA tRNA nucleotidyltransferase n=1 Tax=Sphingomonas sp. GCM10030256 TaxID=3273427 RepID=UPI00361FE2E9
MDVRLDPALWTSRPGVPQMLEALDAGGDSTRLVGGAVRDLLLQLPHNDLDLATRIPPLEVVSRLEAAGIKAIPTGIDHGTVTAVSNGTVVEITTLRCDLSTDGRRAKVAFTDDWRADAERRDFTINAMFAEAMTGAIHDLVGGLADLEQRRVRFIGEPLQRIAEDHLRILRFFRFHARFGSGDPEPADLAACAARANDLMALSRERIADELLKLLALPDPSHTVRVMLANSILRAVLPEIEEAGAQRLERLLAAEREAGIQAHPLRRLAALLPPVPPVAEKIAARLKLSNRARQRLASAAVAASGADARALAYSIGQEAAVDRLLLAGDAAQARAIAGWAVPVLPLSGGLLIKRGLLPGPAVARTLKAIEARWVAEGFPDEGRLAELVDEALASALG